MRYRSSVFLLSIALAGAAGGCASSARVGFPSVANPQWRPVQTDKGRDVIADGDDSCERPESARPDPTPLRAYPCPDSQPEVTRVALKK
jgi:hypothetical protein